MGQMRQMKPMRTLDKGHTIAKDGVASWLARAAPGIALHARSRRGVYEALGTLAAVPVWWLLTGLILALGLWFWSNAINIGALTVGTQAYGLHADGKAYADNIRNVGLRGFAGDTAAGTSWSTSGRAVIGQVHATTQTVFDRRWSFTVAARSVARQESFYPRAPGGGWE